MEKTIKLGKLSRNFTVREGDIDKEKRTVALSFSSEEPVERWFGTEILDHSKNEAVDLKRLKRGGALLIDHDASNQVGVIEEVLIDTADRKGRASVRFGRSAKAEEIFQDVLDGIRTNVSVGYVIDDMILEKEEKGRPPVYRAVKWMPYEISLVSIPADINVGVGRSEEEREVTIRMEKPECHNKENMKPMEECKDCEARSDCKNPMKDEMKKTKEDKAMEVKVIQDEARKQEAERAAEILAIGKAHGARDLAEKFITEGKTVSEFKTAVLNEMRKTADTAIDTSVDMSKKEAREYSYARAIGAAAEIAEGRRVKSFEAEISDELRKKMPLNHRDHGGIVIPLQKRGGLDSGTSTAGAELVYTVFGGELIELLRKRAVCAALGARIRAGLTSPISFPRKTSEGAAAWVAENPGIDASDTDDAYQTVTLSPKSLIRSSSISRQLLVQSIVDAEADIRDSLANSISLAIDLAGLHGTGSSNQPTGIYSASSVNSKAMGGVPTFGKLVDMVTEVAKDNAILGTLGWVTTPGMAGKMLQTLVASSAGSDMIWTGRIDEGLMGGYRAIASNQVSSTLGAGSEHGIIFGNWTDLLIGMFGGIEITVDPYRLKKQAMIEYTMFAMADVHLRHPESFCKATGATIA